jgi:ribosomal protein S18 acetylase RimI-like enzyme
MSVSFASEPPAPAGLILRRLDPEDLAELTRLHAELHRAAPNPGLFVRETEDFFARHLDSAGQILGLRSPGGELVAYSVLGLPHATCLDNFGHDIRLERARLAQVFHLDGTGVHPDWRGRGLQRWLTAERLRRGTAAGRRIALSTVSPGNHRSLTNLIAEGLFVVGLVEKYRDLRFVLRWDTAPSSAGRPRGTPALRSCRVPIADTPSRHCALLAGGWWGRAVEGATLIYAPPSGEAGR